MRAGDPHGTNVWAGTGLQTIRTGSVADIMAITHLAQVVDDDVAVVGARGDDRGGRLAVAGLRHPDDRRSAVVAVLALTT